MFAVRLFVLNLCLLILASCNGGGGSGESVTVNTGGIFNPVSFSHNNVEIQPVHDLGEYLLGTPRKILTFKVRNNSLYSISRLNVRIEGFQSYGFKFNKDPNGVSAYPGYMGTCRDSLPPGGVCDVVLQFETSIKGQYEQDITFDYVNLVENASRPLKLLILAGNPASLIFDGEETNYTFGEKVGLGQLPVVERDDRLVYEKVLTVTNAGDLRARDIQLKLTQGCESHTNGECPTGQDTAYSFTSTCPKILASGESCQATVRFEPKNQDADPANPDPDLNRILFSSTFRYDYLNSLEGPNNKAALNAYFTSTSTNIEALFETSLASLPFETQLTVGNRIQKSVRINNKGFREGKLRLLQVKKNDGSDLAWCVRSISTSMNCYSDQALTTLIPLSDFPFYFKDKNLCFGTSSLNDGATVNVDSGCQLDIFFQPSVTYKDSGIFTFGITAHFDSNWKGEETLKSNFLLDSQGTYLAAARLIPEKVTYAGQVLPITSLATLGEIASFDMGRLGLMSPNSFIRKSLEVTFYNAGDVVADGIQAFDGVNILIPNKEVNSSGVDLKPSGGDNKPHYAGAKIATSYCNQIPPGSRCTISINFAPISKGSVEVSRQYMFDHLDADPLLSYKSFFMKYQDGSQFSDTNFTDVPDSGNNSAHAQLKGVLVAKGVLADLNGDNLFLPGAPFPSTATKQVHVLVSNIGTDKVRYIGFTGPSNQFGIVRGGRIVDSDLSALSTQHAGTLYAPLKDCKGIIDFNYNAADDCSLVTPKIHSASNPTGLGFLNPDETCALTFERYPTAYMRTSNMETPSYSNELARTMVNDWMGTIESWEIHSSVANFEAKLDYYDNDTTNPSGIGNLQSCLGSRQETNSVGQGIDFLKPAKISPHSPYPNASAIIYRRGFTLPELRDEDDTLVNNPVAIPQAWFAGPTNVNVLGTGGTADPDVVRAINSKNYFPASVSITPLDLNDYEYVIHLGTFPKGKNVQTGFLLSAMSTSLQGRWVSHTTNLVLRPPSSTLTNQFNYSFSLASGFIFAGSVPDFPMNGQDVRINFTADEEGLFASEFSYTYKNGDYVGTPSNPIEVTKKILVLAEAMEDAPDLEVTYANYVVQTDGINPPSLTPSSPDDFDPGDYIAYNAAPGDQSLNEWILFDAVKIPTPASTDFYVRKKIVIKNASITSSLTELKLLPKSSPAASITTSLNFGNNLKFCFSDIAGFCKGNCGGVTSLAPGASCYFEVFYQPNDAQVSRDITISASYKMKESQYFNRNIRLSFLPKDPAILVAQGKTKESVRVSFGNISSYPMDFGTATEITADPQIISFDKSTGLKRIQVVNSSETRASFLKAYHIYVGTSDINTIPSAGDYTYVADGINYTPIFRKNYANGQPRIMVYANKPCLVGGATAEDDALPLFKKGFNSDTIEPCYLAVILRASTNYQNVELITSSASLMEENHIRLPYYDNDRSSFSYFNFHFRGKLRPNGSIGSPNNINAYQEVMADSSGTVTFKWSEMSPKHPALGAIVDYRVYYSTSQTALTNSYLAQTAYVDYGQMGGSVPSATGMYQLTQNNLTSKKFYYYRIVPIRYYANYSPTDPFPGGNPFYQLTGKHYLSDTLVPQLTVVVPPPNMFYDYPSKTLVYRDVKSTDLLTFAQAQTACSSMTKLRLSRSGGNVDFRNRLITQTVWDRIVARPEESEYDPYTLSVWLDGTTQNIHSKLLTYPDYNPLEELKYLTASMVFYQKINNCQPNCTGQKAVGTVFHNPEYAGYESYISAGQVFASSRCYVNLNSP